MCIASSLRRLRVDLPDDPVISPCWKGKAGQGDRTGSLQWRLGDHSCLAILPNRRTKHDNALRQRDFLCIRRLDLNALPFVGGHMHDSDIIRNTHKCNVIFHIVEDFILFGS